MSILYEQLSEPFSYDDIEWRIGAAGLSQNNQVWAVALAYLTNRAIMERLDQIMGIENWQNRHTLTATDKGTAYICEIGLRINDEWIWKSDGAQATNFEPIKGGLSDSMKRAAVQWGMGRYLYNLRDMYARIFPLNSEQGSFKATYFDKKSNQKISYKWNPPVMPEWALPKYVEEGNNV